MAGQTQPFQAGSPSKRTVFRCDHVDHTSGLQCKVISARAWNIKRHKAEAHRQRVYTYIPYEPGVRRGRGRPRRRPSPPSHSTADPLPTSRQFAFVFETPADSYSVPPTPVDSTAASTPDVCTPATPPPALRLHSPPGSLGPPTPADTSYTALTTTPPPSRPSSAARLSAAATLTPTTPTDLYACPAAVESILPHDHAQPTSQPSAHESPAATPPLVSSGAPRGPAAEGPMSSADLLSGGDRFVADRILQSRYRDALPAYEVKQSKKTPSQQRGVDWLTSHARLAFEETREQLLNAWGVRASHRDTCILIPEDWRASDPLKLLDLFDGHNYPTQKSRAWYSYADHATTFARAGCWFAAAEWPRRGAELDSFLGCGPWKPMDASHLCHHDHCIVHVVYEPSHVNHSRAECVHTARFLRQENRPVPELCQIHQPPCMTQHAALSALETCYIQFSVLRQAKQLPALPPAARPRRYIYPTFETSTPSRTFSAIKTDPADLVSAAPSGLKVGRPDLHCTFCEKIKAYASIVGFWTHLVHKHGAVDNQQRLEEIRRSAATWQVYWKNHSKGGKYSNPTYAKLEQALEEGFSWEDVLAWELRA